MEKYEQPIGSLEKKADDTNMDTEEISKRLEKLEMSCDDNEHYDRRLCLRINGVELSEDSDGESGAECF